MAPQPSRHVAHGVLGPLALLTLLAGLLIGGAARAQDLITERAWLEDPGQRMTLDEVRQMPVRPYEGVLTRGFGEGAIWLRLRVDGVPNSTSSSQSEKLFLRIRPAYLDDIQVYDPLAPQGQAGVVGDRHPHRDEESVGQDFQIPIAASPQARTLWIRLTSTSTRQIDIEVLRLPDHVARTSVRMLLSASYLGIVLSLTLWALVSWAFHREAVVGAYAIHQATGLIYGLTSLGFARILWPLEWPARWLDLAGSIASVAAVASAVFFNVVLTREFGLPAWIRWLQNALLALQPVKLVMLAFAPILALQINMMEVLLAPLLFLAATFVAEGWSPRPGRPEPVLPREMVQGFYALVVILLVAAALPGLGLMQGDTATIYLSGTHSLITGLMLLLMLQYRAVRLNRQRQATLLALQHSEMRTAREQEIREEQSKLLAMLAHELKTPLATMLMRLDANAPGSRDIKFAISDMNSVIDRCLQAAQLGDSELVARPELVRVDDLVRNAVAGCSDPARVQMVLQKECLAQTDPQLLFIVVSNLLENACKYAEAGTQIHVHLGLAGSGDPAGNIVRVEVSNRIGDAGAPDARNVFQKYYRGARARRKAGTGLGLFLVRSLVRTLGGVIEYQQDTTSVRFVVDLPAAATAA